MLRVLIIWLTLAGLAVPCSASEPIGAPKARKAPAASQSAASQPKAAELERWTSETLEAYANKQSDLRVNTFVFPEQFGSPSELQAKIEQDTGEPVGVALNSENSGFFGVKALCAKGLALYRNKRIDLDSVNQVLGKRCAIEKIICPRLRAGNARGYCARLKQNEGQ